MPGDNAWTIHKQSLRIQLPLLDRLLHWFVDAILFEDFRNCLIDTPVIRSRRIGQRVASSANPYQLLGLHFSKFDRQGRLLMNPLYRARAKAARRDGGL